jgi:hypothetical protein
MLFRDVYQWILNSIRDSVTLVQQAYEGASGRGESDESEFLLKNRRELSNTLHQVSRGAISLIESPLLAKAGTNPQIVAFLQKTKGDLYRMNGEVSEKRDRVTAFNSAEEAFRLAFQAASRLSKYDPVRLDVILAIAHFRTECRDDLQGGLDMIEQTVLEARGEAVDGNAQAILGAMARCLGDWTRQGPPMTRQ